MKELRIADCGLRIERHNTGTQMAEWEEITKREWYGRMTPSSESDWIELVVLEIPQGKIALSDLEFIGDSMMPREFEVVPGAYQVSVKIVSLKNGEKRISRMRVLRGDQATLGARLDGLGCDFWRVGFYDPAAIQGTTEELHRMVSSIDLCAVLSVPDYSGATLPVAFSGMGAGYFPIHELTHQGKQVGLEVVFIGPEELAEHPDQKIIKRKDQ